MSILALQWTVLLIFGFGFYFLAPRVRDASSFFQASVKGKQPSVYLLTGSLVISWIFAKSITNAANLSADYGIAGGLAYAAYYVSFLVAGVVLYRMRTRGGFTSIHHFLKSRFGTAAVYLFSILIGIRLFNEVWSNTMVIGSYFGAIGSGTYYLSIGAFTGLTLAYSLKGGMRSSMLTDAIQFIFFGVLLIVLLGGIVPQMNDAVGNITQIPNGWKNGAWALLITAILQAFSYPFHDPVMTDRAFISSPKVTLKSFFHATWIGVTLMVLFSLLGVFAREKGLTGEAPVAVAGALGVVGALVMNLVMITSAASTLDSAFSSFSKLVVIDLKKLGKPSVKAGRLAMVAFVIIGTLPVFADPKILSATTISGTMVMGLAPVFVFWNRNSPLLSFVLSVALGILMGVCYVLELIPSELILTDGPFAVLLWTNVWGIVGCFVVYLLPMWMIKK